jgi:hypothetical protein
VVTHSTVLSGAVRSRLRVSMPTLTMLMSSRPMIPPIRSTTVNRSSGPSRLSDGAASAAEGVAPGSDMEASNELAVSQN